MQHDCSGDTHVTVLCVSVLCCVVVQIVVYSCKVNLLRAHTTETKGSSLLLFWCATPEAVRFHLVHFQ